MCVYVYVFELEKLKTIDLTIGLQTWVCTHQRRARFPVSMDSISSLKGNDIQILSCLILFFLGEHSTSSLPALLSQTPFPNCPSTTSLPIEKCSNLPGIKQRSVLPGVAGRELLGSVCVSFYPRDALGAGLYAIPHFLPSLYWNSNVRGDFHMNIPIHSSC